MRNQRGITLVALVITIIVLLILAAVTIAALGGQNGILTNASNAQWENELGEAKDLINLAVNEGINEYYTTTYVDGAAEGANVTAGSTTIYNNVQATIMNKISEVEKQIEAKGTIVQYINGTKDSGTTATATAPTVGTTATNTITIQVISKNHKGAYRAELSTSGVLSKWESMDVPEIK